MEKKSLRRITLQRLKKESKKKHYLNKLSGSKVERNVVKFSKEKVLNIELDL